MLAVVLVLFRGGGALAYADDIVLLAPTPSAIGRILKICDDYANEHSIIFCLSNAMQCIDRI